MYFDKASIVACILSACVALVCSFTVLRIGVNYHDEKIELVSNSISTIEMKMKDVDNLILAIKEEVSLIKEDSKSNKENLAYLYSGVASLQKEIGIIRTVLNLQKDDNDDSVKDLPSDKRNFIESLENLVKDGAPFDGLITSYSGRIDMNGYARSKRLVEYSKDVIKSVETIKKDFEVIGRVALNIRLVESFWVRQKRLISEKIASIIKIYDKGKDEKLEEIMDDKILFKSAYDKLSRGDIGRCLNLLERIKTEDEGLGNLISDIRKRIELDSAFLEFKVEFVSSSKKEMVATAPTAT
jgi:hypothetical protein